MNFFQRIQVHSIDNNARELQELAEKLGLNISSECNFAIVIGDPNEPSAILAGINDEPLKYFTRSIYLDGCNPEYHKFIRETK